MIQKNTTILLKRTCLLASQSGKIRASVAIEMEQNGAASIENEEYWNHTASKGIDALFKSVWEENKIKMDIYCLKDFAIHVQRMILKNLFFIFCI